MTGTGPRTRGGLVALVRADLAANAHNSKGRAIVVAFRVAQAVRARFGRLLSAPVVLAYRLAVDWILGVDLPTSVEAGPGLRIWHATGLVVHANTRMGRGVTLRHGTTIGADVEATDAEVPVLGDRVDVGAGATILGPVLIGDDARIGAGAVVVDDVPAGATAVGNPARVLGALR